MISTEPRPFGDDIVLRLVHLEDAAALARAYTRNREHLRPWDPIRPERFFTEAGQAALLNISEEARRSGRAARWVLAGVADGEVYGSVSLNAIELGAFRNARMGYWVDGGLAGRGLATSAVALVCEIAAEEIGLHRIEAGTVLHNAASQRVLAKCGFEEFGVAPKYLHINGAWEDHRMYQRILRDFEP